MLTTENNVWIRPAVVGDVGQLVELENNCFDSDQLSRRSFKWMITKGRALLLVAESEQHIVGYVLLLYHRGTSLGRVYSLAVSAEQRKLGLARQLMEIAEREALEDGRSFLRLEVRPDNAGAIRLYEKLGYEFFDVVSDYYEDHADALRMMKVLHHEPEQAHQKVAHYAQTTDFTCGPAALMMVMKTLRPDFELDRSLELQLWREATTIFMTSGHGGCSPHGLALSAYQRGFSTTLIASSKETPFINGVRNEEKKAVVELVHHDFQLAIAETDMAVEIGPVDVAILQSYLEKGALAVVLISSYRLNQSKSPHWVVLASISDTFVYFHDPEIDLEENKSLTDSLYIPVTHEEFNRILGYGQPRYQAAIILQPDNETAKR
ncbi:MAG: GNAT family N-acetyltransferase/peptidase C39 family protein [Pseudomonadota bacterium]|nr:GNAT family N-acetyltransferase/peptidase C39 family protein [Pseudomonadota bacterium]